MTFIYLFIRITWTIFEEDQITVHIKKDFFLNMLKSQIWRNSQFRESLLADLVYTVFTHGVFLRFDASTKKRFVSFHYHVLFFLSGCYGILGKYCKHLVFLSISRYPHNIQLKVNHQSPKILYFTLCTAVLITIFFS